MTAMVAVLPLDTIAGSSRVELIAQWTLLYRSAPPKGVSRKLLESAVAYALQTKRDGALSTKARRQLKELAQLGSSAQPSQKQSTLTPGARLVRTWNGITHVIDVVDGGYLWDGELYRSLSAIAKAITGARWSGPRFFGIAQ